MTEFYASDAFKKTEGLEDIQSKLYQKIIDEIILKITINKYINCREKLSIPHGHHEGKYYWEYQRSVLG